jgi:hypothetical protein
MAIRLDPEMHLRLRIALLNEGKTLQHTFERYVIRYVEAVEAKHGRPNLNRGDGEVPVEP